MKTPDLQNQTVAPVSTANIKWINSDPYSIDFNDIYYSKNNGLEEAEHTFINANQLPKRWSALGTSTRFSIAETGFGTGLNFLCASQLWLNLAPINAQLHYLAYEKYPLHREDMQRALEKWPTLAPLSQQLLEKYPILTPGFHRLDLYQHRIQLTLVLGDINLFLPQTRAFIDAWFLDGFAPAKNDAMWTDHVFQHIAKLSTANASLATFTSAGKVRRGLEAAGFTLKKQAGYGKKREMLTGHYSAPPKCKYDFSSQPWFQAPRNAISSKSHIAIIGGGLAGTQTAWALGKRGYQISLIDQHKPLAAASSGNRVGMIYTKFSPYNSAQYRFYHLAYLYSLSCIPLLLGPSGGDNRYWSQCGLMQLATSQQEQDQHRFICEAGVWPEALVKCVDAVEASRLIGTRCSHSGLYFPQGGWLSPRDLCRAAIEATPNCTLHTGHKITRLEYVDDAWRLYDREGILLTADQVVIAGNIETHLFAQTQHLPIRSIRGQVTHMRATPESKALNMVVCHKRYMAPAIENEHSIGASFNLKSDNTELSAEDHRDNLLHTYHYLPQLIRPGIENQQPIAAGRVGFRGQTPDYLPIIGPAPKADMYWQQYQKLGNGLRYHDYPIGSYYPGLYINAAHGSRGIISSTLAAEILAAYLNDEVMPVDQEVLYALHPARFMIRRIKRKQKRGDS